jgi:ubiquinone/menaquinone biosynthesis C-methylase UbiE
VNYSPDELFRGTAPYYARYRPEYPDEFYIFLAKRFSFDGSQRVLDLGCGTGQIALPIAALVGQVVGVDPDPGMLDEARRLAVDAGVSIDFRLGDSFTLSAMELGTFDLVTMGASFHWMDREATLKTLDRMVTARGGVVVASGGHDPSGAPPPWTEAITRVRQKWLGPERRAGSGTYSHPVERHKDVLAGSTFSEVEEVVFHRRLDRDLESVVGLQFSLSYSSPALLGENLSAFEDELRRVLMAENPSGIFTEHLKFDVLIATRPESPANQ